MKEFRFDLHRPDAHSALALIATSFRLQRSSGKGCGAISRTSSFLWSQVTDRYLREQLKEVDKKIWR